MPDVPTVTRRSALRLLAVAAVSAAAGCRSSKQQATPAAPATGATPATQSSVSAATPSTRTTTPTVSPPAAVSAAPVNPTAQAAATSERALITAYDDAIRANPQLAIALSAVRADHAAHLKALDVNAVPSPAPVPASSPAPEPSLASPITPTSGTASPATTAVLATLTDLETRAAAARLDDMATATGSLAAVLASIGGCEAAHAATLVAVLGSA